jgi:hypothetical protein
MCQPAPRDEAAIDVVPEREARADDISVKAPDWTESASQYRVSPIRVTAWESCEGPSWVGGGIFVRKKPRAHPARGWLPIA